jgi:hypothetical protein
VGFWGAKPAKFTDISEATAKQRLGLRCTSRPEKIAGTFYITFHSDSFSFFLAGCILLCNFAKEKKQPE